MRAPLAWLLSAIPLVVSATAPAAAEPKGRILGYVTADSRYGAGSITAPVRISALGRRQVRLPGGTWIECRRSCGNTLRQETIDFWHIRNTDPSGDDGPGYFTYKFRY
jgi:hypothetical protein